MTANLYELPKDLPVPVDDGAAGHLLGLRVPAMELRSTGNRMLNLAEVSTMQRTVVYCYPLTGAPNQELPSGWNEIAGARGCTPQSCAFRDHFSELQALNTLVFGLSTQTTPYQQEMAQMDKRENLIFKLNLPMAAEYRGRIFVSTSLAMTSRTRNLPTISFRICACSWLGKCGF